MEILSISKNLLYLFDCKNKKFEFLNEITVKIFVLVCMLWILAYPCFALTYKLEVKDKCLKS